MPSCAANWIDTTEGWTSIDIAASSWSKSAGSGVQGAEGARCEEATGGSNEGGLCDCRRGFGRMRGGHPAASGPGRILLLAAVCRMIIESRVGMELRRMG
jgi:hypothetical protein